MKPLTWKIFALIFILLATAQTRCAELATGLNGPGRMVVSDGYLYFSDNSSTDGLVKRVPISGGPTETIVQGAALYDSGAWRGVGKIAVSGNDIYGDFGGYASCRVFRAPKAGGNFTTLASGLFLGFSSTSLYYFVPFSSIYGLPLAGGQSVLAQSGFWPRNWEFDANAIYFTDYFSRDVKRFDLSSLSVTTLIGSNPSEGGLFINDSYVFFNINGTIQRVPKSGGTVVTLVNTGDANGFVADALNVYYVDGAGIKFVPVDGGSSVSIQSTAPNSVSSMTQDDEYLYWGDISAGVGNARIQKTAKAATPPAVQSNVKMLWATTAYSQSVDCGYEITGAAIPHLEIGVYRGATGSFDISKSVLISSVSIDSVEPGSYTRTIAAELKIDPSHPYVFVVADPNDRVLETNETDNTTVFRKYVLGIVTHGFETDGTFPLWVTEMCDALQKDRQYDATIAFDWAKESNLKKWGQVYEASDRLQNTVIAVAKTLPISLYDAIDTHWIGHSRGASVVSEAYSNLRALGMSQALTRGAVKMTLLDPHPARNYPDAKYYSVNDTIPALSWLLENGLVSFQDVADDPEPSFPASVFEAELYFQQTPWFETPLGAENMLNLWGVNAIVGTKDSTELTGLGTGHSEVHEIYMTQLTAGIGERLSVVSAEPNAVSQQAPIVAQLPRVDGFYPTLVDDIGVADSLVAKLSAAKAAADRGDSIAENKILNAFLKEIRAQRGKHIEPRAADMLSWAASVIIDPGN